MCVCLSHKHLMTEESIPAAFETFRTEIDDYNDRRDRLIKSSRDITTASKRLIFQLHRYPHREFRQPSEKATKVIHDGQAKLREIIALMNDMANREDLCGQREPGRALRHDRAYGGGMEEFVSRLMAHHFLLINGILRLKQPLFYISSSIVQSSLFKRCDHSSLMRMDRQYCL